MYPVWSITGGFLATLGFISLAVSGPTSLQYVSAALTAQPNGTAATVDRTSKGDRLAVPRSSEMRTPVAVVEVVGVNNAAVVYRDRDGRVLFRTDPVANVTLIAKDVQLPEVTIRESKSTVPTKMPVKTIQESERKRLDGCDPMVSPLASTTLSQLPGRCIAAREMPHKLAMAQ